MYVVAGVTGRTGRVVAETLLAQKQPVRLVVRDAAKAAPFAQKGAEVVLAELSNRDALAKAFLGAKGAYLLVPPHFRSADTIGENKAMADAFASAIDASGLPHVVFLSSIGAQHRDGTGPIKTLAYVEAALGRTKAKATFLRAPYFMENWAMSLGAAKSDGVLYTMFEETMPMISTDDIGKIGARALVEGPGAGPVVNLTGPADYSPDDVARELSRIYGREVKSVLVPEQGRVSRFMSAGFPENLARLYAEMYDGVKKGLLVHEPGNREAKGSVTLADVLRAVAK